MTIKSLMLQQYEWVKDSRTVLQDYCASISPEKFIQPVEGFGRGGSIRNLLVHVTNTYQYWIGTHCLRRQQAFTEYDNIPDVIHCRKLYYAVDTLMTEFLDYFQNDFFTDITSSNANASAAKVFMHVTSHEYHHKGQILTMSRIVGYTPIDTDVIR